MKDNYDWGSYLSERSWGVPFLRIRYMELVLVPSKARLTSSEPRHVDSQRVSNRLSQANDSSTDEVDSSEYSPVTSLRQLFDSGV